MTVAPARESVQFLDEWSARTRGALAAVAALAILFVVRPVADASLLAACVLLLLHVSLKTIENRISPAVIGLIGANVASFAVIGLLRDDLEPFYRAALLGVAAWVCLYGLHLLYPAGMSKSDALLGLVSGLLFGWLGWVPAAVGFGLAFGVLGLVASVMIARRTIRPETTFPLGPFLAASAVGVALIFG